VCQSSNAGVGKSIFRYSGAAATNPTTNPQTGTPTACSDPLTTPIAALNVPSAQFSTQAQNLPVNFGPVAVNGQNIILWTVKGQAMRIDWAKPTLRYVIDNNPNFPPPYNVVQVPQANQVRMPLHFTLILLMNDSGPIGSSNKPRVPHLSPTQSIFMVTTCMCLAPALVTLRRPTSPD